MRLRFYPAKTVAIFIDNSPHHLVLLSSGTLFMRGLCISSQLFFFSSHQFTCVHFFSSNPFFFSFFTQIDGEGIPKKGIVHVVRVFFVSCIFATWVRGGGRGEGNKCQRMLTVG